MVCGDCGLCVCVGQTGDRAKTGRTDPIEIPANSCAVFFFVDDDDNDNENDEIVLQFSSRRLKLKRNKHKRRVRNQNNGVAVRTKISDTQFSALCSHPSGKLRTFCARYSTLLVFLLS